MLNLQHLLHPTIHAPIKRKPKHGLKNTGDLFGWFIGHVLLNGNFRPTCGPYVPFINRRYVFCGSCLQGVRARHRFTLYGPGYISRTSPDNSFRGSRLLGVRGHLSKEKCNHPCSPPVVSDPGLLAHRLIPVVPPPPDEQHEIGFVIHSSDRHLFKNRTPHLLPSLVENYVPSYLDLPNYINNLAAYKRIATTSLHGAIFCHSLGIPCGVFSISENTKGGSFKYADYFSSLNFDFKMTHWDNIGTDPRDFVSFVDSHWQPQNDYISRISKGQMETIRSLLA